MVAQLVKRPIIIIINSPCILSYPINMAYVTKVLHYHTNNNGDALKIVLEAIRMNLNVFSVYKFEFVCSGSIVVTTLDCGPGDPWFKSRLK